MPSALRIDLVDLQPARNPALSDHEGGNAVLCSRDQQGGLGSACRVPPGEAGRARRKRCRRRPILRPSSEVRTQSRAPPAPGRAPQGRRASGHRRLRGFCIRSPGRPSSPVARVARIIGEKPRAVAGRVRPNSPASVAAAPTLAHPLRLRRSLRSRPLRRAACAAAPARTAKSAAPSPEAMRRAHSARPGAARCGGMAARTEGMQRARG